MTKILIASATLLLMLLCALAQNTRNVTPAQIEIDKQRERLSSGDEEERREALMKLGAMRLAEASRAAVPALRDPAAIVRASAVKAILSLGPEESVALLAPLMSDKDEFVRRETAYALGLTRSPTATAVLSERLLNDKEDGVRGAAAVALGEIGDASGVIALVGVLAPELSAPSGRKRKREQNVFVLRAAARSLGQIGSRAGSSALIAVLNNEKLPDDVRREAARSLGIIGDPAAAPALRTASTSADPYLSEIIFEALRRLNR